MKITPGVRHMFLAIFYFSLMNLCVKYLSHIPAVEIVFFRSLVSLTISWYILKKQRVPLLGNNRKILITRGVTGTIALIAYFITLQNIPLAGAVTIHYLAPIFTSLMGIAIVKENNFILSPGFNSNNRTHYIIWLGSTSCLGLDDAVACWNTYTTRSILYDQILSIPGVVQSVSN